MSKIMVVEDNTDEASLIEMILEPLGYRIVTVDSWQNACEEIRRDRPDLVFLDALIPESVSLCRWIRTNAEYRGIPVVLLTAVGGIPPEIRIPLDEDLMAGSEDRIEKPLNPETLLDAVDRFAASTNMM
jgi:CheY-like chemotaxis protein